MKIVFITQRLARNQNVVGVLEMKKRDDNNEDSIEANKKLNYKIKIKTSKNMKTREEQKLIQVES